MRHLYTEWEEFPKELIVRSKTKVTFLPSTTSAKKQYAQDCDRKDENDLEVGENTASTKTESTVEYKIEEELEGDRKESSLRDAEEKEEVDNTAITSSIAKISFQDIRDPVPSQSPLLCPGPPPSLSPQLLSYSSSSSSSPPSVPLHHSNQNQKPLERRGEERREGQREKYSPEELKAIQARVKSSLENQGVFLYDPVTGAGNNYC